MAREENPEKQGEENGTDLFDEVFGDDSSAEAGGKGVERGAPEQGKEREEMEQGKEVVEEEAGEEKVVEKPAKRRPKRGKIRVAGGEDEEKQVRLRDKIKRIVVAKAENAAKEDESLPDEKQDQKIPLDKEVGTREEGIREKELADADDAVEQKEQQPEEKPALKPELRFLQDNEGGGVFIGRKQSVYQKYKNDAALFVGQVAEQDCKGKTVFLDSLNPHVVFVCGARGSGKSYIMGVIAEELALRNKNVGVVVIDPVGVFWSMRYPNKEERELQLLAKWNLLPQGLENLRVFIPAGVHEKVPENTYDASFSMPPGLLTTDDWCLTFGIERFSPSGLLLEKALSKVKQGYKNQEEKQVRGRKDLFSLDELIECLVSDTELNSSSKGYKPDSIRALVSRFEAAKNWGVFDENGTPLAELSRENQLSVIDTSLLEDNVSALVIGILARRLLAARKISTRQESAQQYKEERDLDKLLEYGIPPTWLFIDEAHTLIPSGNVTTPASNALVEYVKQGRQPGCSLVFATQQPSAIHPKVLSQLDLMIAHKLVFDDDIKAVYKRTPTIIPKNYKSSSFIKTLPVGVALTGDRREETSRAFVLRIRPRMSQHEGRDTETAERDTKLGRDKVLLLALEMGYSKLQSSGSLQSAIIDQVVKTLNAKYKSDIKVSDVLRELEKKGATIDSKTGVASLPGMQEEEEPEAEEPSGGVEEEVEEEAREVLSAEEIELLAFPANTSEEQARTLFNAARKKRFLGILGDEEALENIQLRYLPLYKLQLHAFNSKKTFHTAEAFVNSVTGEFMHFLPSKKQFIESRGLQQLGDLNEREAKILLLLDRKRELAAIVQQSGENEATVRRCLKGLVDKGFAGEEEVKGSKFYFLAKEIDLPGNAMHPLLSSLNRLPVENASAISLLREVIDRKGLPKILQKLWGNVIVKKVDVVYLPVYEAFLKKKDGTLRKVLIEAVNGKRIELAD